MESFYLKYKENKVPIEKVFLEEASFKGINLFIKRLDKVHPFVSGNKYYKLKYNLLKAKELGKKGLLSFGGAYSNHILALSRAAVLFNMESIGLIRGEELATNLNQTFQTNKILEEAHRWKMQLVFLKRSKYKRRYDENYLEDLKSQYPQFYILPEGGTNELALKGAGEILNKETFNYDYICVPIGSGGTFLGLLKSAAPHQTILGFSALKNINFLDSLIKKYVPKGGNYKIIKEYHFGGFAKKTKELLNFADEFKKSNFIELDFIYNAKMLYGLKKLIEQNFFKKTDRILILHTSSKNTTYREGLNFLEKKSL